MANNCGCGDTRPPTNCYAPLMVVPPWTRPDAVGYSKDQWVCYEDRWYRSRINDNFRAPVDRVAWDGPYTILDLLAHMPNSDTVHVTPQPPTLHPCPEPVDPRTYHHHHHHHGPAPPRHSTSALVPVNGDFAPGTLVVCGELVPPNSCP